MCKGVGCGSFVNVMFEAVKPPLFIKKLFLGGECHLGPFQVSTAVYVIHHTKCILSCV